MRLSSRKLFNLFFASESVRQNIEYCLSNQALKLGLTLQELQVLWIVVGSGRMTMAELVVATTLDKDNLHSIVQSLENDGLLDRASVEGTGKLLIGATFEGKTLIRRIPVCTELTCRCGSVDPEVINDFLASADRLAGSFCGSRKLGI